MILIDSHCHLTMLNNIKPLIEEAKNNNILYLQTICTNLHEMPNIIDIVEQYNNVYGSCGVHPNNVTNPVNYNEILNHSKHPKIISIGETGLDYYYHNTDTEKQKDSFLQHIIAAQKSSLPLIIHTRNAEEETFNILSKAMEEQYFSAVLHCFTGTKDFAKKMLDLGFYISISGIITFKSAKSLEEIVEYVPLDKLLLETDAPYLAPVPMRGHINVPEYLKYTANKIATIKKINLEKIASITSDNFNTLFSKIKIF